MLKRTRAILAVLLTVLAGHEAWADSTWVYTVQISAVVQSLPARVTLNWPQDPYGANNYTVYRKAKDAGSWSGGATLPGSATSYVDSNVTPGATYEYQIVKAASLGYTGYGYICAGIDAPLVESRGKLVLVVDISQAAALSGELARLQQDLVGDGWTVLRHDVSRIDTPANVKSLIQADYNADRANVKAVFLFGHVPILRCGNLNVDGHQARPMPADTFYGDMDGSWGNPDTIPSDVDLMVGRADLFNMPAAGASETELLRNYLNKDHRWRHREMNVPRRALLGNRFGDFGGEAFAASGFRNLEPFVGPGNIVLANEQDSAPASQKWTSMLSGGSYLWAYGCGGGSYTSMSGLGTHGTYNDAWSSDLISGDAKAVFFMMFGSWLGEWDSTDNIMRATLATSTMGLTCSWAGRPHWYYHHMGAGEPIGYSARVSQNNSGLYRNQVNQFQRGVHVALMGDPSLRMHPVAPPTGVSASAVSGGARVSWTSSAESVLGYHVYRASSATGPYTRLTSSLVTDSTFTDSTAGSGTYTYMVRAVKLESTPSGTYYNASQGGFSNGTAGGGGGVVPSVTLTAPSSGSGSITLSATVLNLSDPTGVQFQVDGADVGAEGISSPYSIVWNTTQTPNGTHLVTAVARNAAGVSVISAAATVSVNNTASGDSTAPAVTLTAPAASAMVSGTNVQFTSTASDDVGVVGVQFRVDGSNVGAEDATSPFTIRWNSKSLANGAHRLTAIARDAAGNRATSAVVSVTVSNPGGTSGIESVWFDDALPTGAVPGETGGDSWNWLTTPVKSGSKAHQSTGAGNQQHYFSYATDTMKVNTGDVLMAYVYLDPANPPQQVMLQWNDGSWEHRAYWGASINTFGVEGAASRHAMGGLPPLGQWVRLEIPAGLVGLAGRTIKGMAFTLYGGRATWDRVGKISTASRDEAPLTLALRPSAQGLELSWNSVPDGVYKVQSTSTLLDSDWVDLETVTAADFNAIWIDPTISGPYRFYRVVAVSEPAITAE